MKNICNNANFGFTKWCVALITTGWMVCATGWGQQSITTSGTAVSQNFDALGSIATATLPTGWKMGTDWSTGVTATTLAAGTTGTGVVSSSSGGGFYNWANGVTASSTDRAIGFLNTGSYSSPRTIIYAFQNNTGQTVTSITLNWNYEKFRTGTRAFDWTFFHGNTSSATTAETGGNQSYAADAANTTVNNPPASVSKSVTINGLSIASGGIYYLRWTYTGNGGSSNGQASGVDDFSITLAGGPATPTITLNPATPNLSAFTTTAGTASTAQTFAVTGSNLTADVTVTAPAGFEVSQDGTSFASSQTLTQSGGTLASKTISVRIAAATAQGSPSGNLTLASTGATTANVAVSGTVAQAGVAPTVTAATIPGTFGVPLSATVVASGNPISYAISSGTLPAGLSLDTTTGAITGTPTAAGTGVVVAVTASNAAGPSAPANLTFDIAKGGQTISGLSTVDSKFTTTPSYNLTATASSGLAVAYTSSNEAVATVSGSTVTIVGAGTTTITASQAGDNNYNAATNLTQTLTVTLPPMIAWEMTGQSNGGSSPMVPTTLDNRLVVAGLTKGSGIGAVTTGNLWGGNDFISTDLATAITSNDFATFSVTPASGYQVSFSQIPAYNIRRSGTGPTTGVWQYQKGSGAFATIGSSITWGASTSSSGNAQPAIDLSGIAELQNVPSGTTVTFRVVTWGGTGTAGTWYINTITGDDLAVVGTISEYTAVVPSLTLFTPTFGATGSTVTISGSNLSAVTGVKFNGQSAVFAYQSSDQTIAATVPARLRAGKISLVYGLPEAEVLSTTNFEPLDGSGLATLVNGDVASSYVNTAIFAKGQSDNQTLAVTVSNPIANSAISKVRITLPSDFPLPNSPNFLLNGAGTVSVSGRALTVEGANVTSDSPLTVTISGLSTPDTAVSTALDGNYGITVETAGAGGTLANVLVAPTAYVLVPIINLRGVDANGVPTQAGKKVAFEGVVTASGLGSAAGRTKAYVQDASAAVYIYSAAFTSAPIQGNVYAALGTLTQFRGGTQIDPGTSANLIDRGAGVLPEPTVLTLPISSTVGERYEGSLVKVVGLNRAAGGTGWPTGVTIPMQDSAAATVDLFLQPGSTATTEPAAYPATVVGILGQYVAASPFTTGYQIQPRTQGDLISAPTDTPQEQFLASYGLVKGTPEAASTADPDGDGLNNAGEFAFGTSPVSGASRAVTQESVVGGIKIKWLQRSGINYTVKSTVNLGSSFSGPVSSTPVSPQPGGLGDYQQYEATLTGGDRGFLKVEAFVP